MLQRELLPRRPGLAVGEYPVELRKALGLSLDLGVKPVLNLSFLDLLGFELGDAGERRGSLRARPLDLGLGLLAPGALGSNPSLELVDRRPARLGAPRRLFTRSAGHGRPWDQASPPLRLRQRQRRAIGELEPEPGAREQIRGNGVRNAHPSRRVRRRGKRRHPMARAPVVDDELRRLTRGRLRALRRDPQ